MIEPSLRLRRAIILSNALLVRRILTSHPNLLHNPDFSVPLGLSNTSLHLASSLGHLSIVSILLSLGHESGGTSLNEDHQTALMLASKEGHPEVVHLLCQSSAGAVERQDIRGRDAVMFASLGGHDTCVQILLTYAPAIQPLGLSSRSSSNPSTFSSTVVSSSSGSYNTAAEALLAHADVDGNTALHFASSNGHLLVLRTLLAAGANAERRNGWSWTPVAYSATVSAEVYFKTLITEMEKRKALRREVEMKGLGGGVRMVAEDV